MTLYVQPIGCKDDRQVIAEASLAALIIFQCGGDHTDAQVIEARGLLHAILHNGHRYETQGVEIYVEQENKMKKESNPRPPAGINKPTPPPAPPLTEGAIRDVQKAGPEGVRPIEPPPAGRPGADMIKVTGTEHKDITIEITKEKAIDIAITRIRAAAGLGSDNFLRGGVVMLGYYEKVNACDEWQEHEVRDATETDKAAFHVINMLETVKKEQP